MPTSDFQSKLVSHDSVKSIVALSHVGRSKTHADPGGRSKAKHRSDLLDGSDQANQGLGVKISPDLNSAAFGQQYPPERCFLYCRCVGYAIPKADRPFFSWSFLLSSGGISFPVRRARAAAQHPGPKESPNRPLVPGGASAFS
jgi:hypothetical protein